MNWIKRFFNKKETAEQCDIPVVRRSCLPMFYIDKRYSEMNRRERREYKRWLDKNNMWDGEIVLENLERNKRLFYKD